MCSNHKLTVQAELKADPTRSKTLRREFEREFNKRYRKVLKELAQFMREAPDEIVLNYDFPVGPLETTQLLDFLNESVRNNVLDADQSEKILRDRGVEPDPRNWVEGYLYSSYRKGLRRAQSEVNKRVPKSEAVNLTQRALQKRHHQDRLEQVLGRVYTDLKGITEDMEAAIRTQIAQGLENGEGTAAIAKRIENRVEKIGRTRSKVLARTEVIRTHHSANLAGYRQAMVKGVRVQAEFATAGDQRVCPECDGLEGTEYTLDEVEDLIPVHPNCRCIALPIIDND